MAKDIEHGVDSIRIGGQRLDELPLAAGANAKQQLPAFLVTDRENKEMVIRARYPRGPVEYFTARIEECCRNKDQMRLLRGQEEARIAEYNGHISLCRYRDKLIARLDADVDVARITKLRREFPPYDVAAMVQQIVQSREALKRVDDVLQKEDDSIAELRDARVRCEQRDAELARLGA